LLTLIQSREGPDR
jgi:hypothetical protein